MEQPALEIRSEDRKTRVEHLVMPYGNNECLANATARQTGIDEAHAELLPKDKVGDGLPLSLAL